MQKLYIVRLNSGEELLTRIEGNKKNKTTTLVQPLILIPQRNGNLSFNIFMPYTDVFDNGLTVKDDYIAFKTEPNTFLLTKYNEFVDDLYAQVDEIENANTDSPELLQEDYSDKDTEFKLV